MIKVVKYLKKNSIKMTRTRNELEQVFLTTDLNLNIINSSRERTIFNQQMQTNIQIKSHLIFTFFTKNEALKKSLL